MSFSRGILRFRPIFSLVKNNSAERGVTCCLLVQKKWHSSSSSKDQIIRLRQTNYSRQQVLHTEAVTILTNLSFTKSSFYR